MPLRDVYECKMRKSMAYIPVILESHYNYAVLMSIRNERKEKFSSSKLESEEFFDSLIHHKT